MAISFFNSDIPNFPFKRNFHKHWIKDVISSYNFLAGDLSFIFSSDEYLLKINNEYLNHDYYTDVITFNYCEDKVISGDIFISLDRVKENAIINKTPYMTELQRVMIHGVLHLIGFDDTSDTLKDDMTRAENLALGLLHTVK